MNADELQQNLPEQLRDVDFEDRLEVFGVATGAFLALVGLATIAGMPWTYKADLGAAVIQVFGALATVAVGAGLVWLTQTRR